MTAMSYVVGFWKELLGSLGEVLWFLALAVLFDGKLQLETLGRRMGSDSWKCTVLEQKRHEVEEQGHGLDLASNFSINIFLPSLRIGVVGLDPFFQPRPSTTYDDDDEEDSFDLSNNNLEDVLNDTNTTTLCVQISLSGDVLCLQ